jgi:hypothetical protein
MEGSERHERQNPVGHCNPGNGLSFYWMFKHGTVLAEPCWVLRTNRTPGGDEKVGAMLMGVAFVIGVFWALRLSRQSAKAAPVRSTLSANVTRP